VRRIARGAALFAGGVVVSVPLLQGCGVGRTDGHQSTARLTAAVLSVRDLPSDYLPAEDQEVFRRLVPGDPDCRRLLDLADLRGLRDVPQVHSVFYRADPGATLAEHVLTLSRERTEAYVQEAREAATGCPVMKIPVGAGRLRLHRKQLGGPGFGVRYTGWAGKRFQARYDIAMIPAGGRLMVLAQPTLVDPEHPGRGADTRRLAAVALRKLTGPGGTTLMP
jgi:hypothetical protein